MGGGIAKRPWAIVGNAEDEAVPYDHGADRHFALPGRARAAASKARLNGSVAAFEEIGAVTIVEPKPLYSLKEGIGRDPVIGPVRNIAEAEPFHLQRG